MLHSRHPLCVMPLALAGVLLAAGEGFGSTADPAARGDLRRAETVFAKLVRLAEAAAADEGGRAFEASFRKIFPGLPASIAGLREGDVKVELATAAAAYEAAFRTRRTSGPAPPRCEDELRDSYRKLCREGATLDRTRLLHAKARLHARRAEALLRHLRGDRSAGTLAALDELRAERALDLALAARALAALESLAAGVHAYPTLAEFEERRDVARVSLEQFSEAYTEATGVVDPVLASLPRGTVSDLLRNARNSYRDGLYWWRKIHPTHAKVVRLNALDAPDPLDALGLDAPAVSYTVVCHWRTARKFTARAASVLAAAKHGGAPSDASR